MSSDKTRVASAFAPASVANVVIGFDHFGYSMSSIGDRVTVQLLPKDSQDSTVTIEPVSSKTDIPLQSEKNTAATAAQRVLHAAGETSWDAKIWIEKGIPLSSGLGGSAASAVAGALAANSILPEPLSETDLIECMIDGEQIASGDRHYDNVIPSYKGGLRLIKDGADIEVKVPDWFSVTIHPNHAVPTREARQILPESYERPLVCRQISHAMHSLVAIHSGDFKLLRQSMTDEIIEPFRKHLIPKFDELKDTAERMGAAGFSISGAGPTVMCWCESRESAEAVASDLKDIWKDYQPQSWVTPIKSPGARVEYEIPEYARQ